MNPRPNRPLRLRRPARPSAAEDAGTNVSEIVADAADSGLTLVDEGGDPLQMGTLDAAATLLTGDPYLTSGSMTYNFAFADCDPLTGGDQDCGTPIQAAIDFAATYQPDPIIWIEPYTGDPKEVHPIYVLGGVTYSEELTIATLPICITWP